MVVAESALVASDNDAGWSVTPTGYMFGDHECRGGRKQPGKSITGVYIVGVLIPVVTRMRSSRSAWGAGADESFWAGTCRSLCMFRICELIMEFETADLKCSCQFLQLSES